MSVYQRKQSIESVHVKIIFLVDQVSQCSMFFSDLVQLLKITFLSRVNSCLVYKSYHVDILPRYSYDFCRSHSIPFKPVTPDSAKSKMLFFFSKFQTGRKLLLKSFPKNGNT